MNSAMTLTPRQRRGLLRLGDATIPGDSDLPSFSASGCAVGIDRMLPYMYAADRDSFLQLADACAVLPSPVIRGIVAVAARAEQAPGPVAGVLRLANIGIKGVVMSLYYSNLGAGAVWPVIGYAAHVTMRDPEPNSPDASTNPAASNTAPAADQDKS